MLLQYVNALGNKTQQLFYQFGLLFLFLQKAVTSFIKKGVKYKKLIHHMNFIGVDSLSVIVLTGASVGAALTLQSYNGLKRFGTYQYLAPVVFLGMVKEFGPVLSAIMVAGRAGSAMTAEIGTMKISEQVDALKTLNIDVRQYLIVPRIIATTLILPLLSLFCSFCGIVAGYLVAVHGLQVINYEFFLETIKINTQLFDLVEGVVKAITFGFLTSVIATYKGFNTFGGARDVGKSTTQSVVYACLTILVSDYLITTLFSGS